MNRYHALFGKNISLDIGCGTHKQPGWIGMDIQQLPDVDVVHDINVHPWPLDDCTVTRAKAWHIVEHIPPVSVGPAGTRFPFIEFMDEAWRVLVPGATLDIECPHGGSVGYLHDPTHCNPVTEITWQYFDPDHARWEIYRPKPWKIEQLHWTPDGNVSVLLRK